MASYYLSKRSHADIEEKGRQYIPPQNPTSKGLQRRGTLLSLSGFCWRGMIGATLVLCHQLIIIIMFICIMVASKRDPVIEQDPIVRGRIQIRSKKTVSAPKNIQLQYKTNTNRWIRKTDKGSTMR